VSNAVADRDWKQLLRSQGYRLTPQRQLVIEAVEALGHATPDEVLRHVRQRADAVNASTVYRTLDLLERTGLVTHAHLGHGAPTYHPGSSPPHVHLVCRGCGTIDEVAPELADGLVDGIRRQKGFETDVGHLTAYGWCRACRTVER
jgi:Fur family transcriptional regulator, ferric uptake regulator